MVFTHFKEMDIQGGECFSLSVLKKNKGQWPQIVACLPEDMVRYDFHLSFQIRLQRLDISSIRMPSTIVWIVMVTIVTSYRQYRQLGLLCWKHYE